MTYSHLSHLLELGRTPSAYEIATTKLLYYPSRGFEVKVPLGAWYERYQQGSPLTCSDWDRFYDPRETTYTRYVEIQKEREVVVDRFLSSMDAPDYDRSLSENWISVLARLLAPARYACHGLQMIAAYAGSMAPSGRLVIALALQAADEMRRIERFAYRMRQLKETHAGFGDDSRTVWQHDPSWQPLRRLIEELLVTYDFGEAFVALNLVTKPRFDEFFNVRFAAFAQTHGDNGLAGILCSLDEDSAWHGDYSRALVELLVRDAPANQDVIDRWTDRWAPRATTAIAALNPIFEGDPRKDDHERGN